MWSYCEPGCEAGSRLCFKDKGELRESQSGGEELAEQRVVLHMEAEQILPGEVVSASSQGSC